MKSQILRTVWCNISAEAAGEIFVKIDFDYVELAAIKSMNIF